jgi:hypothetical protein
LMECWNDKNWSNTTQLFIENFQTTFINRYFITVSIALGTSSSQVVAEIADPYLIEQEAWHFIIIHGWAWLPKRICTVKSSFMPIGKYLESYNMVKRVLKDPHWVRVGSLDIIRCELYLSTVQLTSCYTDETVLLLRGQTQHGTEDRNQHLPLVDGFQGHELKKRANLNQPKFLSCKWWK